jgi:hypothetical protein
VLLVEKESPRQRGRFAAAFDIAPTVTSDTKGNVVVGAQLKNEGSCYDVAVLRLAPTTGDVLASRTPREVSQRDAR